MKRSTERTNSVTEIDPSVIKAAKEGHSYSLNQLGIHYYLVRAYDKSAECFMRAAKKGFAPAQTNLGLAYQFGEGVETDESAAIHWWQMAAEQEHADALFRLGIAIQTGFGVLKDDNAAIPILFKAAGQRHPNAEFTFGRAFYHGWGVQQDLGRCFHWYRRSAIHGHPIAQYYMGQAHDHIGQWLGEHSVVPEDEDKARFWYGQAASQGHYLGQYMLGLTEPGMFSAEFKNLEQSAPQGDADTQYKLGLKYYYSPGGWMSDVPADYKKAVYWLHQAAEKGHVVAQNQLGLAFRFGNGVPQDYDEAARWFSRAATQGLADAQHNLARSYRYYGWGGSTIYDRFKMSSRLFLAAAEQGHVWAQVGIAKAYVEGAGVPQNNVRAVAWYLMALNQGLYDAVQYIRVISPNLKSSELKKAIDLSRLWSNV